METAEQVLNAIRLELAKWQDHAVRGMKSGNTAYHQGKITLITDLFAFIHELDSQERKEERNYGDIIRARIEPQPDEIRPCYFQVCLTVSSTLLRLVMDGCIKVEDLRIPIEHELKKEIEKIRHAIFRSE